LLHVADLSKQNVLYLLVVNLPDDRDMAEARNRLNQYRH
jgi:hypothetical protein